MKEDEKIESSASECATNSCCCRKKPLVGILFILVLIAGASYGTLRFVSRQAFETPLAQNLEELGSLQKRLDSLEGQIKSLHENLPAPATETRSTSIDKEIKELEVRIEEKNVRNAQASQKAIATAFAFWDLRDKAKNGHAFASEFATLQSVATGNATLTERLASIAPFADVKTPTLPQLQVLLIEEEKTIRQSASGGVSWWSRIKTALQFLISIRPSRDARFETLEKALASNDASAALEAAKALPEDARENLGDWQSKLEARIALDRALQELLQWFTEPSSEGKAP